MSSDREYCPVSAAVTILGVSRQRVYQLLQSGRLSGRKFGHTWLIRMSSVRSRLYDMRGGVGDVSSDRRRVRCSEGGPRSC